MAIGTVALIAALPVAAAAATGGAAAAAGGAAATGAGAVAATGGAAAATGGAAAAGTGITATIAGTATGEAITGAVSIAVSTGPVGWMLIGFKKGKGASLSGKFDCYKAILHDTTPEPSQTGILFKDLVQDSRVKAVNVTESEHPNYPTIHLTNVWDEKFLIQYVHLENGEIAGHAVLCEESSQ